MKYQSLRSRNIPIGKKLTGIIAIAVLIAAFSLIPFLRNFLVSLYSNSAWFVREFSFSIIEKVWQPWGESATNGVVNFQNTELAILQKENSDLKALLGRTDSSKNVLARVLVKPPQSAYDEMMIDIGTNQGVENNAAIYDGGGALIGKVLEADKTFSKVKLFSSPGSTVDGEILRRGVVLTLTGQGDGSFTAKVPRDFDINEDDIFIIPGINGKPLASVVKIEGDVEDSFKNVFAKGFFEPRSLTWVFVESR